MTEIEEIELWKRFSKGGIEERLDTTKFELVGNKLRGSFTYTKYDHNKLKALPKEKRVIDAMKIDNVVIELPRKKK